MGNLNPYNFYALINIYNIPNSSSGFASLIYYFNPFNPLNTLPTRRSGKIRFHVILGALNVDKDEILELSLRMDNVVPHLAVQEMGNLIRGCDLQKNLSPP